MRAVMDATLWSSVCNLLGSEQPCLHDQMRALPLDYGAYSDLALNIPDWQEFSAEMRIEAEAHLRGRLENSGADESRRLFGQPAIFNFSEDNFSAAQLQRMERWFATEEANTLGPVSVAQPDLQRVHKDLHKALAFMEKADPEFWGEIVALVDQFVVVRPDRSHRIEFTAGTSFALWGAILLNADLLLDWTELYNTLAHEGGHLLLFAIARDEPLVLNNNDAEFTSPVRDDKRPMDGIFHAAFVAAREARALDRLLSWQSGSKALSQADCDAAEESLETSVITFWQGADILDGQAILSPLGGSIMAECKSFMKRNFELVME